MCSHSGRHAISTGWAERHVNIAPRWNGLLLALGIPSAAGGGLYFDTALRKARVGSAVYSRHQALKRASHQTKNTYVWLKYLVLIPRRRKFRRNPPLHSRATGRGRESRHWPCRSQWRMCERCASHPMKALDDDDDLYRLTHSRVPFLTE